MSLFPFRRSTGRGAKPVEEEVEAVIQPVPEPDQPIIAPPRAVEVEASVLEAEALPLDAEGASFPPASESDEEYAKSDEYLWDHLQRIDQYVRAQTVRWRRMVAEHKPPHLWGMVHVTDAEVDHFLHSNFQPGHTLPLDLQQELGGYWEQAEKLGRDISARRHKTPWEVTLRPRRLQLLFGLDDLERDILLVCLLPEIDSRYRRLFAYLQDDAARTRPTVELILQILYPVLHAHKTGRASFEPQSPLLAHHLIVVGGGAEDELPLPMRSVRLDDRIAAFLLGSAMPDGRLDGIVELVPHLTWDDLIITPAQLEQLKALAERWLKDKHAGETLFMHGPYGSGRLKAAQAISGATKPATPLWVADVGKALRSPHGIQLIVDLAYREALLQGAALYWSRGEALLPQGGDPSVEAALRPHWDYLISAIREFPGLTFLASETVWDPAGQSRDHVWIRLDFTMPGYALREAMWQKHLPPAHDFAELNVNRAELAARLANAFQLTEGQILDAIALARDLAAARSPLDARLRVTDLYEGCRRQAGRRLASLARRIEPRSGLTFDDLILPTPNKRQLLDLRRRIRLQSQVLSELGFERRLTLGKGLIALFTGSSGTGKTMAAELLAVEQQVDLYKVDLASIVSKYVGETEQNLKSVFAEAEGSNAILFFDECDALFAKRGEVKEARDRWANAEANYLLQRIEEYAGPVILATNLRQNLDTAFIRRIHVIVEFPLPDADARYKIWLGLFPPGVDRPSDAEVRDLARQFNLSGGSIRNIMLDAAFRAVADQENAETTAITLRHLILAIASEYTKNGLPVSKGAFGAEYYKIVESDILGNAQPVS